MPSPKRRAERFVEPELATLADAAPKGDDWLHELKFDGYRVLARLDHGKVTLFTRTGKDWTARMPALATTFAKLAVDSALIDGELVALDDRGMSDFQALQNSLGLERTDSLSYFAFDLLSLNGEDTRLLPLIERKELLAALLARQPEELRRTIRSSEHVIGRGPEFLEQARKLGVEGIVSKRVNAPYRSGRGRDWLKVKCTERQEFVVVGYTDPSGSRSHFGALVLAARRAGELVFVGRVGTGFSEASLAELHERLAPLATAAPPPVINPPRGAEGRGVHWVEPKLVAEVSYIGFTGEGSLRHPVFHGLRDDKSAAEVELETPSISASSYPLTNPDKVLYPKTGITKREILDYYALVAERMLPHVRNRPLTLVRCPNGIQAPCFFQKHPGKGVPPGVRSIAIRENEGKSPYSVIDDAQGLFGLVQLGALEIHTWGSRADDFERPDLLVFDLDPDPELELERVIACAFELREIFAAAKLETFVKASGGKGFHVCVPIEPGLDFERAKDFSRHIVEALAARSPDSYTASQSKARRKGRIYIDYLRNARGATFIAPYSTRAREGAPVAVPLDWDELTPELTPDHFTVRNVAERLKSKRTDPFARMARLRQRLSLPDPSG